MENQICPACRAENDENAAYCDQCGQPLAPAPSGDEAAAGGCPACGGVVESRGDGKGACLSCGLELVETPEASAAPKPSRADAGRLTAAILRRTSAGISLETAVAESWDEVFPPDSGVPAAAPADGDRNEPCPLCGAETPVSAPRCAGCGLWFQPLRKPQPCPRCERPVSGGKCECGAVLTLPALLEYVDPTVKFVCAACKQPYAVLQAKCPDCGGGLISADRIKAFAAGA